MASCQSKGHTGINCTVSKNQVILRNANTALTVDEDLHFSLSFRESNVTEAERPAGISSVCLIDSADHIIPFSRNYVLTEQVDDNLGEGRIVRIFAGSEGQRILSTISLTAYRKFPDVILVQSSFKNISGKRFGLKGYFINNLNLQQPFPDSVWWSFQGASYSWGQDFVFRLPDTYRRENYMGLNSLKEGGGIPLSDAWNRKWGVALAGLSDKPEDISLPVENVKGRVNLKIKRLKEQVLLPGDSLVTLKTVIIVHNGDYYNPLKIYSALMKPLLPEGQRPAETGYQTEWCTWGYNQNFKPEQIIEKLPRLKELGIKSVILDDGWSLNHGDWLPDPVKFPGGDADFKDLTGKIHDAGMKVWLWWIPGYADSKSSVVSLHPDWLIMNADGSVHGSYGLCPAYPPVMQHYQRLVTKFVDEYRLDGFKLDFREINSAPPCFNPAHHHSDPYDSYHSTPLLFKMICETGKSYNPEMVIEYCSCGIPPNIFHLPWTNLAVTSDPDISQITNRIKMYKALRGDDFPVLEEYNGILAGPLYQLTIGTGGVPGTFSTLLDSYHEKWQAIYQKYQLSRGQYMNMYDIGFDYPEAHLIKKDNNFYYAFYTHPWKKMDSKRLFRFGTEFDFKTGDQKEIDYPQESFSGNVELRGLDGKKSYLVRDYENSRELGVVNGKKPALEVSFMNYLLLEVKPLD
jgi:alpha-galactosidase